jgi:hypothetical protein
MNPYKLIKIAEIIEAMKQTSQFGLQSVLEHGHSVHSNFNGIIRYFNRELPTKNCYNPDFIFPKWFRVYKEEIKSFMQKELFYNGIEFEKIIASYLVWHDCGKPFCRSKDGVKFPNHAEVSYEMFQDFINDGSYHDQVASECIKMDMAIHLVKSDGINEFCEFKFAPLLLLSGLAEIHANAQMTGGYDTQTFKIKFAQIERRGMAVCKKLFPLKNES